MSEPYVIRFDGSDHKMGLRDVFPGVRFKIERSGSTFYFAFTITRDAGIGFRHQGNDWIVDLLTKTGLEELERRLRAGVYPPEEGADYDEAIFMSDQYELLQAIADREKNCL